MKLYKLTLKKYYENELFQVVAGHSLGKAKSELLRSLDGFVPIKFTDIRGTVEKDFPESMRKDFADFANYRDIQFAHLGMRVEQFGEKGTIVGCGGGGAYLKVLFDNKPRSVYSHPYDKVTYFNEDGTVIKTYG